MKKILFSKEAITEMKIDFISKRLRANGIFVIKPFHIFGNEDDGFIVASPESDRDWFFNELFYAVEFIDIYLVLADEIAEKDPSFPLFGGN